MEPAIRHAARGFTVTPYLSECAAEAAGDLAQNAEIAQLYLPGGKPLPAGSKLVQSDYAASLRQIAAHGPAALRSEEHTSELQSLMRISYAVYCLKKKQTIT